VNIESTVCKSISARYREVRAHGCCQIHSVFAVLRANQHSQPELARHAPFATAGSAQQISERVLDAGQAVAIPADQKVLHILPQEYVIDNQEGVRRATGLFGRTGWKPRCTWSTCVIECSYRTSKKCIRRLRSGSRGRTT